MSAIQTYMYILYLLYSYIIVYADVGQEKKARAKLFNATFTFISARVFR